MNVAYIACHNALSYCSVAHINFPSDLQEQEGSERSKRNLLPHTLEVFARLAQLPADLLIPRTVWQNCCCETKITFKGSSGSISV
jgi:hypothetical protein